MDPALDEDILDRRFQGDDGLDRHVWNIREGRVHYFTKALGSHWTPGHSFDDAPMLSSFRQSCRPLGEQADPPALSDEKPNDPPGVADLSGDF